MKKRAFNEFKEKPMVEIEKEIATLRERLRGLKFDLAAGKVKNAKEVREVKRSIAQLLTFVNESKRNSNRKT
jgi:large subunit ribosomal protein L29